MIVSSTSGPGIGCGVSTPPEITLKESTPSDCNLTVPDFVFVVVVMVHAHCLYCSSTTLHDVYLIAYTSGLKGLTLVIM